jgi:hypothetical protein
MLLNNGNPYRGNSICNIYLTRIALLVLTLFLPYTLIAQSGKRCDVYLKDGRVIRGTIYLEDPGNLVQIRTIGNGFWVFKSDQIDSITPPFRSKSVQKNGYFNLTETGVLSGYFQMDSRPALASG